MVRRCGIWMVVLALVVSTGGHWMVLQVCAWTGMVVRMSQEGPLTEAISKTLDGKHPCRLCQVVRKGRADERQAGKSVVVAPAKLDLLAAKTCRFVAVVETEGRLVSFGLPSFPSEERSSPPVPPPRAA